jgi:hypothetical protein
MTGLHKEIYDVIGRPGTLCIDREYYKKKEAM